nr:hypothetical protein [Pseudomonas fluorescens]
MSKRAAQVLLHQMRGFQVVALFHQFDHPNVLGTLFIEALAVDHRAVLDEPPHVVHLDQNHVIKRVWPARTRETVILETPANLATSAIRGGDNGLPNSSRRINFIFFF